MTGLRNLAFKCVKNGHATWDKGSWLKVPLSRTTEAPSDLPLPGTKRWGMRNKAAVVTAVRNGTLALEDAYQRYALSSTEYLSWETALDTLGLEGLGLAGRQLRRRAQSYRDK